MLPPAERLCLNELETHADKFICFFAAAVQTVNWKLQEKPIKTLLLR
jgi:hypothetical protein